MNTISAREARKLGMEPLTLPMDTLDPALEQIVEDMRAIRGTRWAQVRARMNQVEIWRVPNRPFAHSQGPKREGRVA